MCTNSDNKASTYTIITLAIKMRNKMQTTLALVLALLAFLSSTAVQGQVQATDILFYKNGGCDDKKSDYGFCTPAFEGECCEAFDPLCGELACRDCDGDYLEPFWGTGNCTGYNLGICTVDTGEGIKCCMELGSNATCSGHVGPASSSKYKAFSSNLLWSWGLFFSLSKFLTCLSFLCK